MKSKRHICLFFMVTLVVAIGIVFTAKLSDTKNHIDDYLAASVSEAKMPRRMAFISDEISVKTLGIVNNRRILLVRHPDTGVNFKRKEV